MDTSQEYILMCQQAVEIQKNKIFDWGDYATFRWNPTEPTDSYFEMEWTEWELTIAGTGASIEEKNIEEAKEALNSWECVVTEKPGMARTGSC